MSETGLLYQSFSSSRFYNFNHTFYFMGHKDFIPKIDIPWRTLCILPVICTALLLILPYCSKFASWIEQCLSIERQNDEDLSFTSRPSFTLV
jgi:hypothetical protein